jgi:hypothetical protein
MKLRTLLVHLTLATALATAATADPVEQLRELDRLLKEGRISQAEHDRRWRDVIAHGTNAPAPTSSPSVPKLNFKRPEPPRPLNEFSISGGAGSIDVGDASDVLYSATAMLGRFVTPNLQLSIGAEYGRADIDGASLSALGGLGAIDFHVNPTATFVPFVGAGAAYTRVQIEDDSDYDWCWNVHVGVKQTLRPDTAIKYQIAYFDHADFDIQGFAATIGVSWMF